MTAASALVIIYFYLVRVISFPNAEGNERSHSTSAKRLKVNVINLDKNVERWKEMVSQWGKYFDLERFSAIRHANPVCGLATSQLHLFKEFKRSNDTFMLVMEDDAYPGANPQLESPVSSRKLFDKP